MIKAGKKYLRDAGKRAEKELQCRSINGLCRKRIIKSRKEILDVLRKGKKERYPEFEVFYKNVNNTGKFAVLVGLRNGNSVKRNRIKRIYREIYRREKSSKKDKNYIIFRPGKEIDRDRIYSSVRDFLEA